MIQPDDPALACRDAVYLFAMAFAEALANMHDRHGAPEGALLEAMLPAISDCDDLLPGPSGTGTATATECPLLQAALLYTLQAAALPRLSAAAQRQLLVELGGRCRALAAAPAPAEAVVVCGAMSHVLRALGEVPVATARSLRDAVHRLLTVAPPAGQYAAAAVLGQLAAVEGASASELVMEYLSLATLQAASLGSQSGPRVGATYPVLSAADGELHKAIMWVMHAARLRCRCSAASCGGIGGSTGMSREASCVASGVAEEASSVAHIRTFCTTGGVLLAALTRGQEVCTPTHKQCAVMSTGVSQWQSRRTG